MRLFSYFRHIATLYLVLLEITYFSIPISDNIKDIVASQASSLAYYLSIFSNVVILFCITLFSIFFSIRATYSVLVWFKPSLRQKLEERRAARALKKQQVLESLGHAGDLQKVKPRISKCAAIARLFSLLMASVMLIINDAILNGVVLNDSSAEDSSISDNERTMMYERFIEVFNESYNAYILQLAITSVVIGILILIKTVVMAWRGRRQAIALDEESGLSQQVSEASRGFDEKLIDFSESVDVINEKVEEVVSGKKGRAQEKEEVLVHL